MVTRLNSYILPDDVENNMKERLHKTRQNELGFTLCSNQNNIITANGYREGKSDRIEIDIEACDKDEKFLGGYHTHPKGNSLASAEDLAHCGAFKAICIGGVKDDGIRCQIWKQKQISKEDGLIIAKDIKDNKKQPTNKEHKTNFNCANIMSILAKKEDILVGMDKDIDNIKSFLSIINKPLSTDLQNTIITAGESRDTYANKLKEEIENESKKYYNEVKIK